ncbi:MAG: DEAD/DEAH box helicase [Candidatus Omnitrophota bacterium]|jgi:ATP-dependent RNA helicase DeaD
MRKNLSSFEKLGLSMDALEALKAKGFEEPTLIQEKIIPLFLNKSTDIVGQAQTGTGKTAAFGLPLLEKISEKSGCVQALVLTPTRELAIQVSEEINSLKGKKGIKVVAIYGGQSIEQQLRRLKRGVDVVVGTPGRIIDHLKRKSLRLKEISHLILDEADEMLNMGFIDDVEEILRSTNPSKRVLLFSATMPARILRLAEKYMKEYDMVSLGKEQVTPQLTDQIYFEVSPSDKFEALCRIIDVEREFYGLIFCRTKIDAEQLSRKLIDRGYEAQALHGDISQNMREKILDQFRKKRINILSATDVAARGIDIVNLTHVINYSLPQNPEAYVHRIGRTGRAGKEGTAITFVTPEEYRRLVFIKKMAKANIRKEKLPGVEEIVSLKKERIKEDLQAIMRAPEDIAYKKFAKEILELAAPQDVLAAILKHSFQNELDEKSYTQIRDVSVDKKGKARLFVALGRVDHLTPQKLVSFITQKARVNGQDIRDIQIFDKFSFISVPFTDAEIILKFFKKENQGKRPIVVRAKNKR